MNVSIKKEDLSGGTGVASADLAEIGKGSGSISSASIAKEKEVMPEDLDEVTGFGRFEKYGYLPVFADRNSYFAGRDRDVMENIVLKLAVHDRVDFSQYKNWGAGQVFNPDGSVVGWTDPEGFM